MESDYAHSYIYCSSTPINNLSKGESAYILNALRNDKNKYLTSFNTFYCIGVVDNEINNLDNRWYFKYTNGGYELVPCKVEDTFVFALNTFMARGALNFTEENDLRKVLQTYLKVYEKGVKVSDYLKGAVLFSAGIPVKDLLDLMMLNWEQGSCIEMGFGGERGKFIGDYVYQFDLGLRVIDGKITLGIIRKSNVFKRYLVGNPFYMSMEDMLIKTGVPTSNNKSTKGIKILFQ